MQNAEALNKNLVEAFANEVANGNPVEVISRRMANAVAGQVHKLTKQFVQVAKVDTGVNRREIYQVG